ncbi:MAG: amidase [Actinobacteria bacterium]|nr:amidase [Actinomycetota bacterium]
MGAPTAPSAVEWLARLAGGELSSRELVAEYLGQIEGAGALNAVVTVDPERVLAEAEVADARRWAGEELPLLGLPITVKDALDVAGYRTGGGSLARPDHIAAADASAVARLRRAGAVVLAKTNLPEASASYETDNAATGRTDHPLDPRRTPGGSSGGEAALLGADASIAGIGTDGGGSIRVPSHFCGIVGLRPTVGRVPDTGFWPPTRATGMMDLSCVGPMGRYVDDLELLLPIIAGADDRDPYAVDVPLGHSREQAVGSMRIGVYEHDGASPTTPATREAVRRAAAALAELGCAVEEVPAPDQGEATALFFAALAADGGASLRRHCGSAERHHPQFQALLDSFPQASPPATAFFDLQERFYAFRGRIRRWVGEFDAVLCPVVAGPAPRHGEPPAGIAADRYMAHEAFHYVHTYAVAGLPAASVPAGSDGHLPIGVQVVAAPYREDRVLAVARALERALGGFAINRRLAAGEDGS